MANRISAAIERLRTHPNLPQLEGTMAIDFQEHFGYQNAQARAHAEGKLTMEEAQVAYIALGEVWTESNEGWAKGADLATKVTVTRMVGELLGV